MGRVRYGLSNLYYAIATDDGTGTLTYANPVKIPGAKSIALDPQGDSTDEYADDVLWLHIDGNNGYSGDLEFEDTADGAAFYNAVSGAVTDDDDVTFESSDDRAKEFALLGQFKYSGGTETGKRWCFFRCTASRSKVEGKTKEKGVEVTTNVVTITAMPRISDDMVKASCESTSAKYATWFNAVPTKGTVTP